MIKHVRHEFENKENGERAQSVQPREIKIVVPMQISWSPYPMVRVLAVLCEQYDGPITGEKFAAIVKSSFQGHLETPQTQKQGDFSSMDVHDKIQRLKD